MKIGWCNSFFLLLAFAAHGQPATRVFPLDSLDQKSMLTPWAYFLKTSVGVSTEDVVKAFTGGAFQPMKSVNQGYHDEVFWFSVSFARTGTEREIFLEVGNSHIDRISAFLLRGPGDFIQLGNTTGDNLPFNTRSYHNRHFIWPLLAQEICGKTILIRVEKRNSALLVPLIIWDRNAFLEENARESILFGMGFGMMLLVALYALLAWIFVRDQVYGRYFFMICCSILLVATTEGWSFEFLFPACGKFNSVFQVVTAAVGNGALVFFSIRFLNMPKLAPRMATWLNRLLAIYLILLLITPFMAEFLVRHSAFSLPLVLTLILFGNIACVYVAIRTVRQQPIVTRFYLVAYSVILLATLAVEIQDYGFWTLPFNALFVGALIEMLVFSVALTYLMRNIYVERNEFWLSISRYQKEAMQSYIKGIELERQRVSRDLHDDIGSRLANLRRMVEVRGLPQEQLLEQVQILAQDVRGISHRLAPPGHSAKNLVNMVQALAQEAQQATGIAVSVQAFDFPEQLNAELLNELYRIVQEALQNIARHAQAKTADIQLFLHDDELVLTIEDDGRGFDSKTKPKGIGLENMQLRATNAGGVFEITSQPGRGTHILVSIPQSGRVELSSPTAS